MSFSVGNSFISNRGFRLILVTLFYLRYSWNNSSCAFSNFLSEYRKCLPCLVIEVPEWRWSLDSLSESKVTHGVDFSSALLLACLLLHAIAESILDKNSWADFSEWSTIEHRLEEDEEQGDVGAVDDAWLLSSLWLLLLRYDVPLSIEECLDFVEARGDWEEECVPLLMALVFDNASTLEMEFANKLSLLEHHVSAELFKSMFELLEPNLIELGLTMQSSSKESHKGWLQCGCILKPPSSPKGEQRLLLFPKLELASESTPSPFNFSSTTGISNLSRRKRLSFVHNWLTLRICSV